ncbi:MAG: M56 family metallopeptidase [Phycisphaerales bacterium JB039]
MSPVQMDLLWTSSLAAIPIALGVACVCRVVRRPATRHALWVIALLSLGLPAIGALAGARSIDLGALLAPAAPGAQIAQGAAHGDEPDRIIAAPAVAPAQRAPAPGAATGGAVDFTALPARPGAVAAVAAGSAPELATSPVDVRAPSPAQRGALRQTQRLTQSQAPAVSWVDVDPPGAEAPAVAGAPGVAAAPAQVEAAPGPDAAAAHRAESGAPLARRMTEEAQVWLAALRQMRDGAMALPGPPAAVWLGGAALVALLAALRCGVQRRRWRRAQLPPAEVRDLVRATARELKLRRTPLCAMTDDRISPMICCGLRPRLLLPASLWRDLDEDSRRAVLTHELAHLRRRDHMVCWIEAAVGCLYWWHPVVWWARRRIREEADLCCDAWVVALMPTGRRAYAEALLTTRSYLSAGSDRFAGGLPMATAKSRRFSRRLTMVMTQPPRPNVSRAGALIAAAVALSGLLIMPGVACPPEEKEKAHAAAHEVHVVHEHDAEHADEAHGADADASSFELFMQEKGQQGAQPEADQLRDLERRLQKLEQRLQELARQRLGATPTTPAPAAPPAPPAPQAPRAPRATGLAGPLPGLPRAPAPPPPPAASSFGLAPTPDAGAQMRIRYYLPEGKLDELEDLMVRQDVPVLVSPNDDYIVVWGDRDTQQRFHSFVTLIHPEGVRTVNDETGEAVKVTGPIPSAEAPVGARGVVRPDVTRLRAEEAQRIRQEVREHQAEIRQRVNEQRRQMREQLSQTRALESQARTQERQSEAMESQADRISARAEAMWESVEQLQERLCEAEGAERERILEEVARVEAEANSVEREAMRLIEQASQFELQAASLFDEVEIIEEQAQLSEEQIESLEELIEALEEQLEEQLQAIEEQFEAALEEYRATGR